MLVSLFAALLLGLIYGIFAQRTHFCTMGALSDYFLFGSLRRLRGWLFAAAIGLVTTQALIAGGGLDRSSALYLEAPGSGLLNALLGGFLMGYGMVLAGGCPSRALVRMGGGSLKATLVLVVMAAVALPLAPWIQDAALPLPALEGRWLPVMGIAAGLMVIAWCLGDGTFRRDRPAVLASLVFGLLVPMAWAVAPGGTKAGLNFAVAVAAPSTAVAAFAAMLAAGVALGAHLETRRRGSLRVEWPARHDLLRMLIGGLLMGLAIPFLRGCTVGVGLAGLAVLAPATLLALLGMAAGARGALHYLTTGRLISRAA